MLNSRSVDGIIQCIIQNKSQYKNTKKYKNTNTKILNS